MSVFKVWGINKSFVHRGAGGWCVCVCVLHRCRGRTCEGKFKKNIREVFQYNISQTPLTIVWESQPGRMLKIHTLLVLVCCP